VTSNGGGSGSNFSDFTINAGVNATIDGLVIANGHATGTAGADGGSTGVTGGTGGGAAGGIFDAGSLMLTNSLLQNDTATGGAGGTGGEYAGGGAGGSAAGGIYVTGTGTLTLATSDQFSGNSAVGGAGGDGGYGSLFPFGGSGGAGGISGVNGGIGSPGNYVLGGGAGGQPGQPGGYGPSNGTLGRGPGGGGGGGTAFADVGGAGTIIPCYCPGTLIRTARGPRPVESLRVGDTVTTASGAERPIKWIGRRGYGGRFIIGRKDILPICIKAGALDDNVPERELWISPHHAMYLDGVLIEAKDLVNGISIVQAERVDSVEYLHIELESHDVIIAEGALSESYVDDDNRFMFHNAHEYHDDHPVPATASVARYCAPRIDHGYELEAIRHRLALRAGSWRQQAVSSAGELRGSIDRLTPCAIEGWAQDGEHPEAPVCLDIYVDGQLVGQTLANRYREDLRRAGLGSGCHAFEFVPPAGVSLEPGNVEVRRAIDGRPLELATDAERAVA
jgi:hypothetical protein